MEEQVERWEELKDREKGCKLLIFDDDKIVVNINLQ